MNQYIVILETKSSGQILVKAEAETPVEAIEKVKEPGAWPDYPVVAIARDPAIRLERGRSIYGRHLRKVLTERTTSYKIDGEV